MKTDTSTKHITPPAAKPLLAAAFPEHLEIIRKRFPKSVTIAETECNAMLNSNHDRLLLKKEYYNEYCLVELNKGSEDISFTIFKSNWNVFERIERDFMEGFSFAPKDKSETFVVMNTLV